MDCNGSGHIVGLVTSLSLIKYFFMRNQNKRQTNGLFALIFNETFSLCIKLYIHLNTDDVIVVITKH